ncbi:MAG: N-acetyltransferase, partial [Dietzia sp.]|nr:N-acetyltransferase [Dietzia sp.]
MSDVIEMAASRRREIFAAVSSADGPEDAVGAVASLLSVSADEAGEVLRAPLEAFAGSPSGGPAGGAGQGFTFCPFTESE